MLATEDIALVDPWALSDASPQRHFDFGSSGAEVKKYVSGSLQTDDQFTYDVFDRRIVKRINGTVQQYTVYDGGT